MSDEEVLPSDEDELEEVLALRQGYWTDAARSSCRNLKLYGPHGDCDGAGGGLNTIADGLDLILARAERQPSPPRRLGIRASRSDDEGAGRARKRVKVCGQIFV